MPDTTFLVPSGRDPALMAKYGLGGAAVIDGLVFTGAMALDLATLTRLPQAKTIADETRICFNSIAATLGEAGCTLRDVAKVTCWLTDDSYRAEFWATFTDTFAPGPYPKRLTLVAGMAADCRVELEVLAVQPAEVRDA
jgi:enamine deaminase RidA (YjgF/YER057c/UK114 family)